MPCPRQWPSFLEHAPQRATTGSKPTIDERRAMSVATTGVTEADAGGEPAPAAPLVVVLAGCERFVSGRGHRSFARAVLRRFRNGEPHVRVPERVEGGCCILVGSISPPAGNLERVTLVAHALRRAAARQVTALLPYLAYARQDRAARGESLGLSWVGGLLRASGIDEVVCVDVHGEEAGEVLRLPLSSLSPAELLADALPETWRHDVTFVPPRRGCPRALLGARARRWRRSSYCLGAQAPHAYGVEHLGLVGSPGRRAVLVDDILDTGDTLVSCCRQLRDAGVREIGVVATHGLFTGERWRALFSEGVQEMWITDTVLSRRRPPQARVVAVAPLLASVLEGST
jgi:ribose-phosphate pyrophosphokinase